MKKISKIIAALVLLLAFAACKDPYMPKIDKLDKEIIVVDGFIDGSNETIITITRVQPMGGADTTFEKYVTNAVVAIEDDFGNRYPLMQSGQGSYRGRYYLGPSNKYKLSIQIGDKNYASDLVSYKMSPPIDAITYRMVPEGARFFVNTHDPTGQSKYYRWTYDETWQFRSFYQTNYKYDATQNKVVDLTDSIYNCWQFDRSRQILIKTTENLQSDVMNDVPLLLIPNYSFKLSYLYSIKVKQYVLDSLGYQYYRQLKKNTEETGSIFDPQPGNLRGNLHNVDDPNEIVVGYIGAGSTYEVRQFFRIPWDYREDCNENILVPKNPDSLKYYFDNGGYWPLYEEFAPAPGWVAAYSKCVDCTIRGTNVKPAYWP